MRTLTGIFLVALLSSFLSAGLVQADPVLCLKNKVPASGVVNLKKAITTRSNTCLKRETRIDTLLSSASILSSLLDVDGAGSALDADTLDGSHAASFASAADLDSAEANISSLSSSLASTDESVEDLGLGPNLVRVGTADAQYTDLAEAVSYVASQSRGISNRWVIQLGPGQYDLDATLTVPSYTELRGSGKRSTIINGQNGIDVEYLVGLSDYTALSDLTVRHSQNASLGTTGVLKSLTTVDADPDNPASFAVTISNCHIEMTSANPSASYGLLLFQSDTRVERSDFLITGSSSANYGIYNQGGNGDFLMTDSHIYTEGSSSYAVLDMQEGKFRVFNSTLTGSNYALNKSYGEAEVRGSRLKATNCARAVNFNTVTLIGTTLECTTHIVESTGGDVRCVHSNDESGQELDSDCAVL